MKILGIDTSTKTLCCGLSDGKKDYEYNVDYATKLSKWLVPALHRILDTAKLSPKDIDVYACGIGPGSFTGLRIGMACVKGLAWGCGKPVIGVPSLDILALNAKKEEGAVCAVSDAKRGLVYTATYRMKKGRAKRISPYALLKPEDLLKGLKGGITFVGDGIPLVRDIAAAPRFRFLDKDYWKLQGHNLLELAKDGKQISALTIKPLYLYPKECQIKAPKC